MAQQPETTTNWLNAWADVQRKSWESWSQLTQQAFATTGAAPADPWQLWQQGLQRWQQALFPKLDNSTQEVYQKLMDQSMGYLRWNQEMFRAFQGMQTGAQLAEDWMQMLNGMFEKARDALGRFAVNGNDMGRGWFALWGLPLDTWRRVASSLSLFPGDALHGVKEEDAQRLGDTLHANLQRFLSIPPVGYTREWQEQSQEAAQVFLQYQQALSGYMKLMAKVGVRAMELLQRRLVEMASAGQAVQSVREFYNLTVDAGEDAYAEVASAPEFGEASARLVNASIAVKRHSQRMAEEIMGLMNLPTRRELDSAHFRVHDLKNQVTMLQQQVKEMRGQGPAARPTEARSDGIDRELRELRQQVQALREGLEDQRREAAAPAETEPKAARSAGSRGGRPKTETSQAKGE